jgi:hypothetical protein
VEKSGAAIRPLYVGLGRRRIAHLYEFVDALRFFAVACKRQETPRKA